MLFGCTKQTIDKTKVYKMPEAMTPSLVFPWQPSSLSREIIFLATDVGITCYPATSADPFLI